MNKSIQDNVNEFEQAKLIIDMCIFYKQIFFK